MRGFLFDENLPHFPSLQTPTFIPVGPPHPTSGHCRRKGGGFAGRTAVTLKWGLHPPGNLAE
jgi:hypothetical protein